MDTELLVDNQIDDGYRLLVELVRSGLDVESAAWIKIGEHEPWHLYVGSPSVDPAALAATFRTLYACLRRLSNPWISMSDVKFVDATDPLIKEAMEIRDRYPGGRLGTRVGGRMLGDRWIEGAYVYPRITSGLTPDEAVQTVVAMMNRKGLTVPSTFTLRDDTRVVGIPYGLEMNRQSGQHGTMEVKILDDVDRSTHLIPVDKIVNIH